MKETSAAEGMRQTPLTRAMATIRALRQRLDEQEAGRPIAIVGVGLRLPGGIDNLDGYWHAVAEGRDLVRPLPAHRKGPFTEAWNGLPQRGGFLDEVLDFDAGFFGISPREARHLDPQHRLLLEVAWEAMENAALPADRLSGLRTGLYLGIMWQDYREWLTNGDPDAYWTTGNGHNFAAGRIAYSLGLTGPALAVDTACSSSLVAVHLAVQALHRGECEVAFAAGVNLIMSPHTMRLVQETRSLSPDGLCRTFDARANGFVRGEGCGAIVLKRLDHAVRDGDRIHAVIHGTAVNQDGRSGGFTAPNPLAQVALIESALAASGLEPSDLGFVETHGTGTALGDPIELEALAAALGRRNAGAPLAVGAVKTNFGHLESAAGIAGLIKALLCLRERRIPPVVHFRTLNPRIDLSGTGIAVPAELTDWPEAAGRYAGVSSFGMSGTNAHIILGPAEPAQPATEAGPGAPVEGFELSAQTPAALRALAARYADFADTLDAADYPAFAYTATKGRTRHEVRVRISAGAPAAAADALRAVAAGAPAAAVADASVNEATDSLPRRIVDLPTYPWQRERFAPEAQAAHGAAVETEGAVEAVELPTAHELVWEQAAVAEPRPDTTLALAGDDQPLLELLAAAASAQGLRSVVLGPAEIAAGRDDVLVLAMKSTPLPERADATGDPAGDAAALCMAVTTAVTGAAAGGGPGPRVFAVTRASRRVKQDDQILPGSHNLLHGLAPVLGLEVGDCWGGVIDLCAEPTAEDARTLLAFVAGQAAAGAGAVIEDLAAVRDGAAFVGRLRTAPEHAPRLPVRADATYIVTGGLGAVGRELVGDLVRRGARHLLLIGRRAPEDLPREATELLGRARAQGARIVYRGGGCDTPYALAAACSALYGMPDVRGVVHAAGTLHRVGVAELGPTHFAEAFRSKAAGAWWLHLASRIWPLDFFVLVSSVSALWGTEGCAAYSAANAALDALAAHRTALGLAAASIAYGPWALDGGGMADAQLREKTARMGVGALHADAGRAALTARTPGSAGHVVACPLDLPRLAQVMAGLRHRGLFAGAQHVPAPGTPVPARELSIAAELAALAPKARAEAARGHVARLLAAQLGYDDAARIRRDVGFFDLGLDSITAVDLAVGLSQAFEVALPAADLFDHPTVTELAAHLLGAPPAPAPTPTPVTRSSVTQGSATSRSRPVIRPAGPEPAAGSAADFREPIAIVGMAGRFPQAGSVEELWELLRDGRDPVTSVPPDRFDPAALGTGRITTDQGGFLGDIDRFDAAFFGIPAREAESLDPQQRLLLESAWHALEDAGIDPKGLRGSRTGVYVGVSYADYARVLARSGPANVDAYYGTGTALNAAAGRLAFTLGLNGPALAVDTACSSSLVALHLAVRSLRSGESDAALAGGVNILLDPMSWVAVSQAHMLSPDGRCRTFSADANGFVRSEGCGVLVLKRLSDARRGGDRVLAVIRGTAVNQDGASSGLTAPSGRAQEALLTAALDDAGVSGAEVSYLEAHGTGTSLGDPVELAAAWRVLGHGRRPGAPLHVGSVKSNIGHCESAAGIAGVVKTVLALRHGLIPANLHFGSPNPQVDWPEMNLRVVDGATAWRRDGGPRVAGVSGFGFTGTNAHVVLADAPDPEPEAAQTVSTGPADATYLLALSAPDPAGLERLSAAWRKRLEGDDEGGGELAALAATAAVGRSHFPHRRAALGRTREQLLSALAPSASQGTESAGRTDAPRVAFLFSGQGSQYFGMGRELYETEPVFRETFEACDRVLAAGLGAPLAQLVFHGEDPAAINETRVTQPALVALETALAALWESWGVTPAAVMGHSVGEISAAIHAGVMDLPTGLGLIADRARLMQGTERGSMLAVVASEQRAAEWAEQAGLDVAAVNGPEATVLSGAPEAVAALAARLKEQGVRSRALSVSHAFHSRLLEPALDGFAAALRPLEFRAPALPIISNLTGRLAEPAEYDAGYWLRHARRPVRFHDGARQLAGLGIDLCLEIGPDRTLVNLVSAAGLAPAGAVASSLRRGTSDRAALLAAARALYLNGQDLDWAQVYRTVRGRRAAAPRYPFADTRYWAKTGSRPVTAESQPGHVVRPIAQDVPAWGTPLRSPALRGRVFATERSPEYPAHLTDHRLYGTVSVPGASQTATVLSALGTGAVPVVLEDLHFPRALVLREGERYQLQIIEAEQEHGTRTVSVQSLLDPERGRWQEHLAARVVSADAAAAVSAASPAEAPDPGRFAATADRHLTGEDFYRHLRALGYHLGPSFRWIGEAWIRGDEALIALSEPREPREDPAQYEIHPGLLDSCLQSSVVFAVSGSGLDDLDEEPGLAIPFAVARLAFPGRPAPGDRLWCHVKATRHERGADGLLQVESADLHLFGTGCGTVLTADGFRFRRASRLVLEQSLRHRTQYAYELGWIERQPFATSTVTSTEGRYRVAIIGGDGTPASGIGGACAALGHEVSAVHSAQLSDLDADLILDARFAADATSQDSHEALACATALAETLRTASQHIPYVVLAQDADAAAPMRESLWGMLASVEAELSERRILRVTFASDWEPAALAGALGRALDEGIPETRLEVGRDRVRFARLLPCTAEEPSWSGTGGAALITGGLGALGLSTARFLAAQGVPAITLMARSAPDAAARTVIDELTALGTSVRLVRGDVTDPQACRDAVVEAGRDFPLRTVLHLAGATRDQAFGQLTPEAFAEVFHAKARGAAILVDALRGDTLDALGALVFFSSASTVLGSAGQANYAAANGYLDGLAHTLRARGVPAVSIAWGPWTSRAKSGLADSAAARRAIAQLGIRALADEEAHDVLALALSGRRDRLVAVAVEPERYFDRLAGHPRAAFTREAFAALTRVPASSASAGSPASAAEPRGWLRELLGALEPEGREDRLRETVRDLAGDAVGDRSAVDEALGFAEAGLDSIMVIDLRTRLSHALGEDLPATVALDHPTVARLSAHLVRLLFAAAVPAEPVDVDVVPAAIRSTDDSSLEDLSFEELVLAVQADMAAQK